MRRGVKSKEHPWGVVGALAARASRRVGGDADDNNNNNS